MSELEIGNLVVCVDAKSPTKRAVFRRKEGAARAFLRNGAIYRISATPQEDGVQLEGCPLRDGDAYYVGRFRKIQKADNAFTAQMWALKPVKQKA